MKPIKRSGLAFLLLSIIDHAQVTTIEEVHRWISERRAFDEIKAATRNPGAMPLFDDVQDEFYEEWAELISEQSDSDYASRNGWCLLLGYVLEGIQRDTSAS